MPLAMVKFRPLSRRICWPSSTLVPSMRTTTGTFTCKILGGGDDSGGENIATQNSAENIDEDGFDPRIANQYAEGVFDLIRGGAAADIEEVGGGAASVFDDVHGGHGEAGAVDHAGDGAVELDVVQAVLGGFDFERIFLVEVAQFAELFVAEEAVIIESHFGVERDEAAVAGDDSRIDF